MRKSLVVYIIGLMGLWGMSQSFAQDTLHIENKGIRLLVDSIIIADKDSLLFPKRNESDGSSSQNLSQLFSFVDSIDNKVLRELIKEQLINRIIRENTPQDILYSSDPVRSVNYFKAYAGKLIRKIKVVNVDIFSGSVSDTTVISGQEVNKFHIPTRERMIYENILFDKGDKLEPFRLSDSERILRSLAFIRDARFYVQLIPGRPDEVDITIVIQDRVPLALNVGYQGINEFRLGARHKSLFGTGNEMGAGFLHKSGVPNSSGYDFQFRSRNIRKSFINTSLFVADNYRNKGYGISVSRGFVSPSILYTGELSFQDLTDWRERYFADTLFYERSPISRKTFDGWISRAFPISYRNNMNLAFRYLMNDFDNRPQVEFNINEQLHNRHLFLATLAFTELTFYKTRNIYGFNITEDVPTGLTVSATAGYDFSEFKNRQYAGLELKFAEYRDIGYTYFSGQLGGFLQEDQTEDVTLDLQGQYFSPLIGIGQSLSRLFFKGNYLRGYQLSAPLDFSLSVDNRIRDLTGAHITGNQLIFGSLESVFFLGKEYWGFRFAPYIFTDFGWANDSRITSWSHQLAYNVGSGIRIRNESLVFNTFDMRLSYFPSPPEGGKNLILNFTFTSPISFKNLNLSKPLINGIDLVGPLISNRN